MAVRLLGERAQGGDPLRPVDWLESGFDEHEVPAAVVDTFLRGGRNLQRIDSGATERETAAR